MIELVRGFGGSNCDAVLDPCCSHFSIPEIEGVIGYKFVANCAIVFGDPVCKNDQKFLLAKAFEEFCKNRNIIYVAATEGFEKSLSYPSIDFGNELILDPFDDPKSKTGPSACLLRRKIKHAQKEGLTIKEYREKNLQLEEAIEEVGKNWLASRKGPQIYISHVRLFDDRLGKRWFFALLKDKIVGVVVLNELQSKKGWHLNHLMDIPSAPGGTCELLVNSVIETLKEENCHYLSFGTVPRRSAPFITGFSRFRMFLMKSAYNVLKKILKIEGRQKFWEKFDPQIGRSFLLIRRPKVGLREIIAIFRALNFS